MANKHDHTNDIMYNENYDQCRCGALLHPDTNTEAFPPGFVSNEAARIINLEALAALRRLADLKN